MKSFKKKYLIILIAILFICLIFLNYIDAHHLFPIKISLDKIFNKYIDSDIDRISIYLCDLEDLRKDERHINITNKDDIDKIINELSEIKAIKNYKPQSSRYKYYYTILIYYRDKPEDISITIHDNGNIDLSIGLDGYIKHLYDYKINNSNFNIKYIDALFN